MPTFYDDNYGFWEVEEGDEAEHEWFYFRVQRKSRPKKCKKCGRTVFILPDYDLCNRCADEEERM